MAVTWKRIAYFDEITGAVVSRFQKGIGGVLSPIEYFHNFTISSLFDEDANGDLMPSTGTTADAFFTLNGSDDIQPSA